MELFKNFRRPERVEAERSLQSLIIQLRSVISAGNSTDEALHELCRAVNESLLPPDGMIEEPLMADMFYPSGFDKFFHPNSICSISFFQDNALRELVVRVIQVGRGKFGVALAEKVRYGTGEEVQPTPPVFIYPKCKDHE